MPLLPGLVGIANSLSRAKSAWLICIADTAGTSTLWIPQMIEERIDERCK